MQGQGEIADYARLLWHRRRLLTLLTLALFALGAAVTLLIPAEYTATATLLFEQPRINLEADGSAPRLHTAAEIQATRARIMTASNLEAVVKMRLLGGRPESAEHMAIRARQLREQIALHVDNVDIVDQNTGRAGEATIGFTISYFNASPAVALGVVTDVVDLFLQESASRRASGSARAVTLLNGESQQLQARIEALNRALADFKRANAASLPEIRDLKLTQLERFNRELADLQNRIGDLEDRKGMRAADLAMLSPKAGIYSEDGTRLYSPQEQLLLLRAEHAAKSARYSPQHPDLIKLTKAIEGLERYVRTPRSARADSGATRLTADEWEVLSRRDTARPKVYTVEAGDSLWTIARQHGLSVRELAQANGMSSKATLRVGRKLVVSATGPGAAGAYTDAHPDVKRLTRKVASGEQLPLASRPKLPEDPPSPVETPLSPTLSDNPSYLRMRAEVDAIDRELARSRSAATELRTTISKYEDDLSRAPEVERQLNELLRQHEEATEQLDRIKAKQLDAELAEAVDTSAAGGRFALAEPPSLPARPDKPNRRVLLFLSLLLAFAGSSGFVLISELRRDIIYDAGSLQRVLSIRPLVSIPEVGRTACRRAWRGRRKAPAAVA